MPAKKPAAPAFPPAAIESRDAADVALGELSKMAAQEAAAKAICDKACKEAIDAFTKACIVKVDGVEMNIADRRQQLAAGLETFGTSKRAELFPAGAPKSIQLNHGEIGFRDGNECVMPIEGTESEVKKKLLTKVVVAVAKALTKLVCGGVPVLRVGFEINKAELIKGFALKKFTAAALKKFGLKICVTERFFAEPKSQEVASQPKAAA